MKSITFMTVVLIQLFSLAFFANSSLANFSYGINCTDIRNRPCQASYSDNKLEANTRFEIISDNTIQ